MGVGRARDTRERLQAMTRMGSSAPQDLAEVYRATYRALVRFLYRKVWDAERAEDLAQEAFARALVHKPENARGWLFIVAANMARDDARRAARERRHLTLLTAEPQESTLASDEAIEVESDRARVRAALDELSPRDRGAARGGARATPRPGRAPRGGAPGGRRAPAVSSGRREASHPLVVEGAPAARVGSDGRDGVGNRDLPREGGRTGPASPDGIRHTARGTQGPAGSDQLRHRAARISRRAARRGPHATRGSGPAWSGGSPRNGNGRHPAPAAGLRNCRWGARGEGVSHQPRQRACATRGPSPPPPP